MAAEALTYNAQRVDLVGFQSIEEWSGTPNSQVSFFLKIGWKHTLIEVSREPVEARVTNQIDYGLVDFQFRIDLLLLQDLNTAQEYIEEILSSTMDLTPDNLNFLKVEIGRRAAYRSLMVTRSHHKLALCAVVQVLTGDIYRREDRTRIMNDIGDQGFSNVPASSSLVQAIRTKKLEEVEIDQTCSVCLDQFSFGEEVAEIPCAHVFHRRCIVSWLEQKNTCSLCRFEMPGPRTRVNEDSLYR